MGFNVSLKSLKLKSMQMGLTTNLYNNVTGYSSSTGRLRSDGAAPELVVGQLYRLRGPYPAERRGTGWRAFIPNWFSSGRVRLGRGDVLEAVELNDARRYFGVVPGPVDTAWFRIVHDGQRIDSYEYLLDRLLLEGWPW